MAHPDLWKAIAHLHPAAQSPRDYVLVQDDENGPRIAEWRLPEPQPTTPQIAAAITAYDAAQAVQTTEANALRQLIITTATGTVGLSIAALTTGQIRALVACLLYEAGALDNTGVVQPLNQWLG